MATPSKKRKVTMELIREEVTKRYVKYHETSTAYMGSLYIRQETFQGGSYPERLTVTLEYD